MMPPVPPAGVAVPPQWPASTSGTNSTTPANEPIDGVDLMEGQILEVLWGEDRAALFVKKREFFRSIIAYEGGRLLDLFGALV